MFVYENFEFENLPENLQKRLFQTNFFVSDILYDEQKMLKICKIVSDLHIGMMTVNHSFVEHIWKWVEKRNMKICAFVDGDLFFENEIFNFSKMFSAIKNSFQNGANFIDIKPPESVDLSEVLKIAINAVSGKSSIIKIAVNREKISNNLQTKDFMRQIYSMKILNFKTENFIDFGSENSSDIIGKKLVTRSCDVNAMIDFVHQCKSHKNMQIDIVANAKDENGFDFYDTVKMLCSSIFEGESFFTNNVFFTHNFSSLNEILQQNS